MKGFSKRQQERAAKRLLEAQEWEKARERFHHRLEEEGVLVGPLVVDVRADRPAGSAEWLTWWRREELSSNIEKVGKAVADNYITEPMLHGKRFAEPGESGTVQLWLEAQKAGPQVLDAAMMLTAMRATAKHPDIRAHPGISDYRSRLFGWAYDALKAASVDPYTLSTVWFLPVQLETDRGAKSNEELVDALANNLAAFLAEWSPVRVLVRDSNYTQPLQPTL